MNLSKDKDIEQSLISKLKTEAGAAAVAKL
jgi:hypothetical protein